MKGVQLSDLFNSARVAPTELSIKELDKMVMQFPAMAGSYAWWKFLNPNTKLMLSLTTIALAGSMLFYAAPQTEIEASIPEITSEQVEIPIVEPEAQSIATAVVEEEPARNPSPSPKELQALPLVELAPEPIELSPEPLASIPVEVVPAAATPPPPASTRSAPAPPPISTDANTRDFPLSNFTGIKLKGSADVIVSKGPFKITAEGEEEHVAHLVLSVKNDMLVIDHDKKKYRKKQKKTKLVTLYVSMPDISRIELSGFGDISLGSFSSLDDLAIDVSGFGDLKLTDVLAVSGKTTIEISGFGNVEMRGSTDLLHVDVSGFGDVVAKEFNSKTCVICLSGFGDIEVSCSNSIKVKSSGFGDVTYHGEPQSKEITKSGFGNIEQTR